MKRQIRLISFSIIFAATMNAASAPQTSSESRLEPFGLQGKKVTSLGIYFALYAATDGDGVFRRDIFGADTSWVSLGLQGKEIRSVYPHKFGPVEPAVAISVGVAPHHSEGDSVLIYCSTHSQPEWTPMDSSLDRREVQWINSLDGFPDPTRCGETFAAAPGKIFRRGFTNPHWEMVLDIGAGLTNVVRADLQSGHVWAGGETTIFAPWLAKSTDKGDTWEIFYPDLQGDNACDAIAIHPGNPDIVYAGMEGAVIKTTDGGKSWHITLVRDTPVYFYGLALDSSNPDHIYAGGIIANPSSWALWESFDGGATWQEILPPLTVPTVAITGITSLVADPSVSGAIYIATSGHGVWKYESATTGVNDPDDSALPEEFMLEQNYPNPFLSEAKSPARSGGNPATTIRFEIPPALSHSKVQLAIFDLRGELVRELINRQLPAGNYVARWDGKNEAGADAASGIYFYRLQVGNVAEMRKLSLLK